MPRKRLIFTLLYQDGYFWLSRNFRLQRVGDAQWLNEQYNFSRISSSIDELVILDVSRNNRDSERFINDVLFVTSNCFLPLTLGGGIRCLDDAHYYICNGADKILLNSPIRSNPSLMYDLVSRYGSQCVIASVDFKYSDGNYTVYLDNGSRPIEEHLLDYLHYLQELRVGEIYLNSIDQDGTGQGYFLQLFTDLDLKLGVPLILAGGAGNEKHLLSGISVEGVDAVATANLFNFIGDGLPNARQLLLRNSVDLAVW